MVSLTVLAIDSKHQKLPAPLCLGFKHSQISSTQCSNSSGIHPENNSVYVFIWRGRAVYLNTHTIHTLCFLKCAFDFAGDSCTVHLKVTPHEGHHVSVQDHDVPILISSRGDVLHHPWDLTTQQVCHCSYAMPCQHCRYTSSVDIQKHAIKSYSLM